MAAPPLVRIFPPSTVIAAGFLLSAVGFGLLTQLSSAQTVWPLFVGMLVLCLGIAPIGTITTDLVMAQVPPERAGAASGISETSFEFGGALGIAVLGSIVTAVYRAVMADEALAGLPPHAVEVARDTLGGAIAVARELPGESGTQLIGTAREAFVYAFEVAAGLSAAAAVTAAVLTARLLRGAQKAPRAGSELQR